MRRLWMGFWLVGTMAATWAGCSSGSNSGVAAGASAGFDGGAASGGSGNGSSGGAAGGGGTAASGGSGNTGGSGNSGNTGGSGNSGGVKDAGIPDVQFNYDAPPVGQDACAAVTVEAELVPLDLYVVIDRSGSMVNSSLGPLRWPPVRDALNAFFQSPQAKGIGIAITMFAHPTLSQCTPTSYQTPMVAMAPLPGNASGHAITLQNTMNANAPVLGVGTPTESAMKGAVTFAKNYKNSNPNHTVAIVLATDGIPGAAGCTGETAAGVTSAITAGFSGTPSVRTFVIGIDQSANITNWANGRRRQGLQRGHGRRLCPVPASDEGHSGLAARVQLQHAQAGGRYHRAQQGEGGVHAGFRQPGRADSRQRRGFLQRPRLVLRQQLESHDDRAVPQQLHHGAGGSHREDQHRAGLPRLLIAIAERTALWQVSVHEWTRAHRRGLG